MICQFDSSVLQKWSLFSYIFCKHKHIAQIQVVPHKRRPFFGVVCSANHQYPSTQDIFNTPRIGCEFLYIYIIYKYIYIPSISLVLKIMWNPKFFMVQSPTWSIGSIWHQDFWSAHVNSPVLIKDLPGVVGPTVLSWDSAAGVFGLHSSSIARPPLATPNWGRANVWGCPQQLFRLRFGAQDLGLCPWLGGLKDA